MIDFVPSLVQSDGDASVRIALMSITSFTEDPVADLFAFNWMYIRANSCSSEDHD